MECCERDERDKQHIDDVTAAFYGAFTNNRAASLDVDRLYRLFIPEAVIVKNVCGEPVVYDVAGFIEPRRKVLSDGSLADFSEAEVSETTSIFGNIAQRFSRYEKSWIEGGQRRRGAGAKCIQFVRTPDGWRIACLVWDDEM